MLIATCLTNLVARASLELLVVTSETLNSSVKIKSLQLLLIWSFLCTCSLGEACQNVSDVDILEDSIDDEDDTPSSIHNFIYEDIQDLYLQLDEEDKEQETELEDFRPDPSKRQKL
ncbi:hypothetical protein AVEN_156969-1 [Araneus ventricosus]|uniref:Uncharacterized protein n=1 Tax=Araneus ventricosus TaxID=182803 RepID=A0A4Y2HKZ2_ARAVE|nr:hypothetical protein AVEN_156969-1 [Araneus ventricosus]